MLGGNAAKANAGGTEIKHASWGRPGYSDPHERLRDMDTDGVDIEVLYCEVSVYRYLYLLESGAAEATRAFNDTLHDFASADPSRLVVTYQVPIHDIDLAVAEIERVASMGGKSLQLPVFPAELDQPDYFDERYDRMWAAISASGLPICCHIGLNTALNQLADRDPTPRLAWTLSCMPPSACEALGMWLLTGIFTRYPGAEGRVRGARARLGRRVPRRSSTTWCCARATSSRCSATSCRASTTTATWR